ncbi:MAG: hypothetical protein KDD66_18180 [Bdellovibrionales bacterium]|nr:hypothetical protein [Bdellovibrionales bacterium]
MRKHSLSLMVLNVVILVFTSTFLGCSSVNPFTDSNLPSANTVDVAEIHTGMQSGQVQASLGKPSAVKRDHDGSEVWIYDRLHAEASYREVDTEPLNREYMNTKRALLVAKDEAHERLSDKSLADTDKTVTLIIKIGPEARVDSFSYYSNRF